MTNEILITFAIIMIPMVISRLIMEKALGKLNSETKLKLLEGFAKQRKYRLLILIPILFVYLLLLKFFTGQAIYILVISGILFITYFLVMNIINYRKIKAFAAPRSYLNSFKISVVITALAFIGVASHIYYIYYSGMEDYKGKYTAYEMAGKGVAAMNAKNYPLAIINFTQAIAIDTTQGNYYTNRGTCYYNSGNMKAAKSDWVKAATMGDKNAANWLPLIKE